MVYLEARKPGGQIFFMREAEILLGAAVTRSFDASQNSLSRLPGFQMDLPKLPHAAPPGWILPSE
jgi:hypothetical protein